MFFDEMTEEQREVLHGLAGDVLCTMIELYFMGLFEQAGIKVPSHELWKLSLAETPDHLIAEIQVLIQDHSQA